jgi:fumarylacetoacetate (FAA) hydrolase
VKLVTYTVDIENWQLQSDQTAGARLGWVQDQYVVDVVLAQKWVSENKKMSFPHLLPSDLMTLLERGANEHKLLQKVVEHVDTERISKLKVEGEWIALPLKEVTLFSPLPRPRSFRDFYAFEQHVRTCRAGRGLKMVPEWYEIPVFYFSNHHAIKGPNKPVKKPDYTACLDFELEVACIIGKYGKNIVASHAREYIAGLCILNDWSARDVQMKEVKVGLGPAKGKDFATSLGPYLVTLDELEDRRIGDHWDLNMSAKVNGKVVSQGNLKDLYWSFAQMIERASDECALFPGDVIGSGTVGTGCILELGTEVQPWLMPGDVVELEVERLGLLRNVIQ